ncbi:MAG: hypothetical protein EXR79_07115 [Myxococcales bacterium]|nr:hypothetical protein [Myxococcales bacterium]
MPPANKSTAFLIQDLSFIIAGAKKHAKALPPAAAQLSKDVSALQAELQALNVEQEQLKGQLKAKTATIQARLRAARAKRLRVVKLAEGTFGPKGAEMADFRSKGEG